MDPATPVPVFPDQVASSRIFAGSVTSLLVLSSAILALRIYTRHKSNAGLLADDWIIMAAFVFAGTDWITSMIANSAFCAGPATVPLWFLERAGPLSVVSAVMASISIPLIKISVAVMLLRLLQSTHWKVFLWILIGVQVVMAVYGTISQVTRCIPLNALWDPLLPAHCWSIDAFHASMTVLAAVTIATDLICSLIPITFLRSVKRSRRERAMIGILMSLGLLASAASVVKTVMVHQYISNTDPDKAGMAGFRIAFWTNIEEQLGIIAACVPCLKALSQRLLQKLGLVSEVRSHTYASFEIRTTVQYDSSRPNNSFGREPLSRVFSSRSDEHELVEKGNVSSKAESQVQLGP